MASSGSPRPSSTRQHQRISSADERRRGAMPRRSTKGPLDLDDTALRPTHSEDDPLKSSSRPQQETEQGQHGHNNSPGASFRMSPDASIIEFPDKDFSFLLRPEIYHPISQLDVPAPFRTPQRQPLPDTPLEALLAGGYFRHAAIVAAKRLTQYQTPPPASEIFALLYTRLASLTLISNTALAAEESKCLADLTLPFYFSQGVHIVPWDLRVLTIRLQSLGYGDWRRGIAAYYDLGREARKEALHSEYLDLWKRRLKDLGIRVANALVESGDFEGAARHLRSLRSVEKGSQSSLEERQRESLVWLRLGDVNSARSCIGAGDKGIDGQEAACGSLLSALCDMADEKYEEAARIWQSLADAEGFKSLRGMIKQNLAACLLYSGKVNEAQDLLSQLVERDQDSTPFPVLAFNLCTIYELCSEKSKSMKLQLAENVAQSHVSSVGDGLDLPSNPEQRAGMNWKGWRDMTNADFKL